MLDALKCRECGASPRGMKVCHDVFDDLLGMKYLGNGVAYRVAVACYTFQHPESQPAKAWCYARDMLRQMVHNQCSLKEAYERAEAEAQPTQAPPQLPPSSIWSCTIMDFAEHLHQEPTQFALQWAASLLASYQQWHEQALKTDRIPSKESHI